MLAPGLCRSRVSALLGTAQTVSQRSDSGRGVLRVCWELRGLCRAVERGRDKSQRKPLLGELSE